MARPEDRFAGSFLAAARRDWTSPFVQTWAGDAVDRQARRRDAPIKEQMADSGSVRAGPSTHLGSHELTAIIVVAILAVALLVAALIVTRNHNPLAHPCTQATGTWNPDINACQYSATIVG